MKLLLTSNGLCNKSIRDALQGMLDKPASECNFVFVTTSSNPVRGDKSWLVNDIYNAHKMGWKKFDIIDVAVTADWPKKLWRKVFEDADVLMFGGGHAPYLSYWLDKTGLMDELPKLLSDKVYIGISAGSIVATKSLITSSTSLKKYANLPDDETKMAPLGQSSEKALGLVDFLFRPHLNSTDFPLVREDFMRKLAADLKETIYLVDDDTAVSVVDGKVDVISEGEWLLIGKE